MKCNFCGGAASAHTGCQYGPNTIACYRCTVECWAWVRKHTSSKAKRQRKGPTTALSFYECAGNKHGGGGRIWPAK